MANMSAMNGGRPSDSGSELKEKMEAAPHPVEKPVYSIPLSPDHTPKHQHGSSTDVTSLGRCYHYKLDVDKVRFMVDFYEIDSWDLSRPHGPDCIYIWVDNTRLFIGYFGSSNNERNRSGSKDGIRWESSALVTPRQIGFGSAKDQKHRIKVYIPPSFYGDGKIRVRLQTVVNGNKHDESAGWDNIRLAYLYFCHRRLVKDLISEMDLVRRSSMSRTFSVQNDVGRGLAADDRHCERSFRE